MRLHAFLWKDSGSEEIITYKMNHLTFGDSCSSFKAIFATRKRADDFGAGKKEIVEAIRQNF